MLIFIATCLYCGRPANVVGSFDSKVVRQPAPFSQEGLTRLRAEPVAA